VINQGNSRKRRETTKDREASIAMTVSVRLSVCVFVCLRGASLSLKIHVRSSPDLWASYLWPWLGPPHPLPALRFVMYFRFMDDDDVMFAPQCPGVYSDTKRRALKVGLTFHAGDRTRSGVVMTESYRPTSLRYTTVLIYKYQLSPVDPRDKIVLLTALDDLCDTL